MKLELSLVDVCLPDYWQGHSKAHIQIAVWPGMSLRDIKEACMNEIRFASAGGHDRIAYLLTADWVPEKDVKDADKCIKAVYAAINRLKPGTKGKRKFFTDLEESDDSESVYAYFVIEEI